MADGQAERGLHHVDCRAGRRTLTRLRWPLGRDASARFNPFDRPVFAQLRRMCLSLPETKESSSWGHPSFRAGKRVFCAFEVFAGRPSIAFRVTAADAKGLARKKHFFAPPYGRGVWVSRWVDVPVGPKLIETLIDRSYRLAAPKKLVRLLDSSAG